MAETLIPWRALLLGAAWLSCAAQAQEGDPTRPPAALSAPVAGPIADSSAPLVQTILVSQRAGGRRIALIDGKFYRQGQRVGDAVLETIRPTEVVLRQGKQRTTLKLFRPPESAAAAQP